MGDEEEEEEDERALDSGGRGRKQSSIYNRAKEESKKTDENMPHVAYTHTLGPYSAQEFTPISYQTTHTDTSCFQREKAGKSDHKLFFGGVGGELMQAFRIMYCTMPAIRMKSNNKNNVFTYLFCNYNLVKK